MGHGLVQSVEEAQIPARLVTPRERELEAEPLEAAELVVERREGAMNGRADRSRTRAARAWDRQRE